MASGNRREAADQLCRGLSFILIRIFEKAKIFISAVTSGNVYSPMVRMRAIIGKVILPVKFPTPNVHGAPDMTRTCAPMPRISSGMLREVLI
jgi:hypothetical protein